MKKLLLSITTLLTLGLNAQSGLNNLSFETWTTTPLGSLPVGWFGMTVNQQNTGAQSGTSYARVVTTVPTGSMSDGYMLLSTFTGTGFVTGAAYAQRPISLNGFYKTSGLAAGDSVNIYSELYNGNTFIGGFDKYYTANLSSWTAFSITYSYVTSGVPDTLYLMGFSNIEGFGTPNAMGSTLDLDNLSFAVSVGIDEASIGTSFLVYPNPANNELNIISKNESAEVIRITDINGKVIDEIKMVGEKTHINLQDYAGGIYTYSILDHQRNSLLVSKLVITH